MNKEDRELEKLDKALWAEEESQRLVDADIDQFLRDFRLTPDKDEPRIQKKPPVRKPRASKLTLVLAITACLLSFGIVGMLVYWMERFL